MFPLDAQAIDRRQNGTDAWFDRIAYAALYILLFRNIQRHLGFARSRHRLCAGASISPETLRFFDIVGRPVSQGYGLTESGGVDRLKSQLEKVQSDAKQVTSSAKGDFPSETDELESSISALETSVRALPSSPSAEELKGVVPEVTAVGGALRRLKNATDSKCS